MKFLKKIERNGLWVLGTLIILLTVYYVWNTLCAATGGNIWGMFGLDLKEVGAKFNNITSPVVALSAAILFFFSFGAQYFANQKNWSRLERIDEESHYSQTLEMLVSASSLHDYFRGLAEETNSISTFFIDRIQFAARNHQVDESLRFEMSGGVRNLIFLKNNFTIFDIFHKECYSRKLTDEHRLNLLNHLYIIYNTHNLFSQIIGLHDSLEKLENTKVNRESLIDKDLDGELKEYIKYFGNLRMAISTIYNSVYQVQGFDISTYTSLE